MYKSKFNIVEELMENYVQKIVSQHKTYLQLLGIVLNIVNDNLIQWMDINHAELCFRYEFQRI